MWADGLASGPVSPFTSPQVSLGLGQNQSVFVTGPFRETTDLNPGAEMFPLTSRGGTDIFVAHLDALSGTLRWAGHGRHK